MLTWVDWTSTMQQTFEYYVVDPGTWLETQKLDNIINCTIDRDADSDTLGSASIDISESVGECYIRCYLVVTQNGLTGKEPLGTFLVQTPTSSFNGHYRSVTMDAYTPLIELKENMPPIGYYFEESSNVMDSVYSQVKQYVRAPVIKPSCDDVFYTDFVANTNDTWATFLIDAAEYADYNFALDEVGRVFFMPDQETASLQPVWTYTDDNSSILYPDIEIEHDLFDLPNVVEVVYSDSSQYLYSCAKNEKSSSPTSISNRGREILYRETSPSFSGTPTQEIVDAYAEELLKEMSIIEYTVTYKHGYCPVRLGDCVRLNYSKAGLSNVKAKVTSQSITCEPGCPVEETAVITVNLMEEY